MYTKRERNAKREKLTISRTKRIRFTRCSLLEHRDEKGRTNAPTFTYALMMAREKFSRLNNFSSIEAPRYGERYFRSRARIQHASSTQKDKLENLLARKKMLQLVAKLVCPEAKNDSAYILSFSERGNDRDCDGDTRRTRSGRATSMEFVETKRTSSFSTYSKLRLLFFFYFPLCVQSSSLNV